VGGEYRQIHFRWGALGQGSRTALPICGRFLQLVLSDPQFQRYHQRFQPCKEPIDAALYSGCSAIGEVEEFDSTMLEMEDDSLFVPLTDDINPDEKLRIEEPSSLPDSV
jgi:penicillin-binding protein 1A